MLLGAKIIVWPDFLKLRLELGHGDLGKSVQGTATLEGWREMLEQSQAESAFG